MKRALVLDADQPAALAVVRSLARRGIVVDVGEKHAPCLSSRSRHAGKSLVYPDPLARTAEFVDFIVDTVRAVKFDLVIPMTDDTLQPLAQRRADVETHCPLAAPSTEALAVMTDKRRTLELARELGVRVPESLVVSNKAELQRAAETVEYPVVVKPARSISDGAIDVRSRLTVSYASDREELEIEAGKSIQTSPVVLQEHVKGVGVGVEVLAEEGEIKLAFQHRRLHELPLTGGGSSLREGVPVDPILLDYTSRLMKAVNWNGVAMAEFKHDEATGRAWLMEVNGRFWGSLPLAVHSGADFPYGLFQLHTNGSPSNLGEPKIGLRSRKFSYDVAWTIEVLRGADPRPLAPKPSKSHAVLNWFSIVLPGHRFDVQSLTDPWPGIVDFFGTIASLFVRLKAKRRIASIRQRGHRDRRNREASRRRMAASRNMLFVCYGNINRSALAEHDLRHRLGGAETIDLISAGFHPRVDRPADAPTAAIAKEHGVDLSPSRSRLVTDELIAAADIIFAMDANHVVNLQDQFPDSRSKTYLLSTVVSGTDLPIEIVDPYCQGQEAYTRCFEHVTACTSAIAEMIGGKTC